MARVDLNLASRPFLNRKPWLALLGMLALTGGLMSFDNAYRVAEALALKHKLQVELEAQGAELSRVQAANTGAEGKLTTRRQKKTRDVAVFTKSVLGARALSWTTLFNDLEKVTPRDLRIVAVNPEISPNEVKLRMECMAKNNEVKLEFYDKLYEAPFDDPLILSENVASEGLQFSVTCRYLRESQHTAPTLASTEAKP